MPRLAIVHPDYSYMGGGEAVSFNIIEALQENFNELDLFVFCEESPKTEKFNEYFDTNVDSSALTFVEHPRHFQNPPLLSQSLLHRQISARLSNYDLDLVVSTQNEFDFPLPSVQYIHNPNPPLMSDTSGAVERIYSDICQHIAGFGKDFNDSLLVANSDYTAEKVKETYDVRPEIIYPPIDTRNIIQTPWSDREDGFVTIGRISTVKNVLHIIDIIKRLKENGCDIYLHIIGPPGDEGYYRQVVKSVNELDYVYLEGELTHTDSQLERFVSKHKYAISYCEESFGISVAEVAASGLIPFVYDQGGQTEIVPRTNIQFSNRKEAVEKIKAVLDSDETKQDLRDDLRGIDERFNRERFQDKIVDAVESQLDNLS